MFLTSTLFSYLQHEDIYMRRTGTPCVVINRCLQIFSSLLLDSSAALDSGWPSDLLWPMKCMLKCHCWIEPSKTMISFPLPQQPAVFLTVTSLFLWSKNFMDRISSTLDGCVMLVRNEPLSSKVSGM